MQLVLEELHAANPFGCVQDNLENNEFSYSIKIFEFHVACRRLARLWLACTAPAIWWCCAEFHVCFELAGFLPIIILFSQVKLIDETKGLTGCRGSYHQLVYCGYLWDGLKPPNPTVLFPEVR